MSRVMRLAGSVGIVVSAKMTWIGNLAPEVATILARKTSPAKTTDDLF